MPVELDRNGKGALYVQIRDILARRIDSGEYAVGHLLPSVSELCAEFGVSTITVRQSLDLLAQEGVIGTYPGRGVYVRDTGKKPKNVAMVSIGDVEELRHSFEYIELVHSVQDALARRDSRLSISFVDARPGVPTDPQQLRLLEMPGLDGVLILCHWPRETLAAYLQHSPIPAVCLTQEFPGTPSDSVVADNQGGSENAVAYLVALGHRRIAYFTWPPEYCGRSAAAREAGYISALREFGIEVDPELMVHAEPFEINQHLERMLKGDNPPTAIMAMNDRMAAVIMSALAGTFGISAPDQISVMGYDDSSTAALLNPPLTTVAVPWGKIGELGVELLFERIAAPEKTSQKIVLDTRLVKRASCGPGPEWPGKGQGVAIK